MGRPSPLCLRKVCLTAVPRSTGLLTRQISKIIPDISGSGGAYIQQSTAACQIQHVGRHDGKSRGSLVFVMHAHMPPPTSAVNPVIAQGLYIFCHALIEIVCNSSWICLVGTKTARLWCVGPRDQRTNENLAAFPGCPWGLGPFQLQARFF